MLKSIIVFLFSAILFLHATSVINANTIFFDSFSGGYNSSYWIKSNAADIQTSPFGLKDDMVDTFSLTSIVPSVPTNNVVKVDMKINAHPSNVYLFCRNNDNNQDIVIGELDGDGTTWGTQFIHGGGSRTQGTNWDTSTGIHSLEVNCNSDTVTLKEDNHILYSNSGFLTFSSEANQNVWLQYRFGDSEFANYQLCDLNDCTKPSNDLNVHLFKQTDPSWGAQEYDSGNRWAPGHGTIGNYGCAMTSSAMILKYYGINKLPDNTDLDPGSLNTWLKNQPDGYVGDGLLNWLAISRLSKLAKPNNTGFSYDALEFKRTYATNSGILTDDITNNQPDILEEPGHFIVGKGINNTTFDINDPYYNRETLDKGYQNTFLSMERFIPSHTDLSYIMLTVNTTINITVQNSSGSTVGEQYVQQPLGDALNNGTPSGQPLKIFYLPKPTNGNYKITLSGNTNQPYQLNTYLYDTNGTVKSDKTQGFVGLTTPNQFTITYNNQNLNNDTITKIVTFQTMIDDINKGVTLQQINPNIGKALIPLVTSTKDSEDKGQKIAAKLKLNAIEGVLNIFRGKGISEPAFQILLYDATYLRNYL